MGERSGRLPQDVDLDKPSAARCYDYYLGGAHNFAIDRELAQQVLSQLPHCAEVVQNNRAFLRRAVRFFVGQGIRQFLDIGSGIPTAGNVHEIAQELDPEARVVYVDNESVAVAHSRAILADNDRATIVQADFRDVAGVLNHAETRRLLDFSEPIGLILVAPVHFVPESDRPSEIIRAYSERLVPGSLLGLSHLTEDDYPEDVHGVQENYEQSSNPSSTRSRQQVAELLAAFELVEPGLVYVPNWHRRYRGGCMDRTGNVASLRGRWPQGVKHG